jgi:SAM-dependent methyltransferase
MEIALGMCNLGKDLDIIDIGGRALKLGQDRSYAKLLVNNAKNYWIPDINSGGDVTHIMKGPYLLPYENNSIDLVLSGQVLEHVDNPFKLVEECKRVLKPGCFMIHIAPSEKGRWHDNPDNWRFGRDAWKAITKDVGGLKITGDWIDQSSLEQRSRQWADHVMVGKKL